MRVHLSNARLTQSAHIALDSAGQFLIATNQSGRLKWATPQAQSLFDAAGLSSDWLENELALALEPIFSYDRRQQSVLISEGERSIEVEYISETHSDEHLLRLVDSERPSDEELLQNAYTLTGRESEVLLWLARGKGNAEIAMILGVSPRTVNKHLEQVFRKLSVENRTSAAVMALKALEVS